MMKIKYSEEVYRVIKKEKNIYNYLFPEIWNIIISEYICIDANNIKTFEYVSEYIKDIYINLFMLYRYLEYNYVQKCRKELQTYILSNVSICKEIQRFYYYILNDYEKHDKYPHKIYASTYFQNKYIKQDIKSSDTLFTFRISSQIEIKNLTYTHEKKNKNCENCTLFRNRIGCLCKKERKCSCDRGQHTNRHNGS